MELKKRWRPTMIRTNARFRGPTESLQYMNMVNEAIHDMILLGKILDETEGHMGQSTYIRNNFARYVNGDEVPTSSNIQSASTIYVKQKSVIQGTPVEDLSTWTTVGCSFKAINGNMYKITANGTTQPAGIYRQIEVEAGDIILLRMAVIHSGAGNGSELKHIYIGSSNVNKVGSFSKYALPQDHSIGYIDHVIECLYREKILLEINIVYDEPQLQKGEVTILYPEVKKLYKNDVSLIPVNTNIKSRINTLEAEIRNLLR